MSITFTTDARITRSFTEEPCLCSQMAPGWPDCPLNTLGSHALATCRHCGGTGIERVPTTDEPSVNVANVNAHALLALLGLIDDAPYLQQRIPSLQEALAEADDEAPSAAAPLHGTCSLPSMRRALLKARATFDRRAPYFTRPDEVLRAPLQRGDGVVELAERVFSCGLSAERLSSYLGRLEQLALWAQQRHGTQVSWA